VLSRTRCRRCYIFELIVALSDGWLVGRQQEWEIVPNQRSEQPQGLTALFGDGHVNFCIGDDIFAPDLWLRLPGYSNGPANQKELFKKIIKIIERNHQ
jgi:hypothetical protein